MTKTELKKIISNTIKVNLKKYKSEDVLFSYSKDGIEIEFNNQKIGLIEIKYLSGKHVPNGAILAITLSVVIKNGIIWDYLNKMNLSFRLSDVSHDYIYRLYSSNLIKYAFFRNYGVIAFYPNENLIEKSNELFINIEKYFFKPLNLIVKCHISLIDDIIEFSDRYRYPITTALIVCHFNNKPELIENVIYTLNKKKVFDRSEDKINEVNEKLKGI